MKHSITLFTDKAQELLRQVSCIASQMEKSSSGLTETLRKWLSETEEFLKQYNCAEQATFAAIRASVAAIGDRGPTDKGDSLSDRRKRRKQLFAQYINEGAECLYRVYMRENIKVEEARKLITQVILVALQNGHLHSLPPDGPMTMPQLTTFYSTLYADNELRKGLHQALALVSYPDILRLTDETLSRILYAEPRPHDG